MNWFKKFLLFLLLMIMALPLLEFRYKFVEETGLKGNYATEDLPYLGAFTWKKWMDGTFQGEYQKRVENHVGFRNSLIRVHSQFDYSVFGIGNDGRFFVSHRNVLLEDEHVNERSGKFFIGKTTINRKVGILQDITSLLKAMGIDLIPVLLPDKADFFPEMIPSPFQPGKTSLTNYEYFRQRFNQYKIPYLDLNRYFHRIKDTCRYPLFPNAGAHWSTYGMLKAMDTLLRFTEKIHQTVLPHIRIDRVTMSDSVPYYDYDLGDLLNLIIPLKLPPTVFPQYSVVTGPGEKKLRVLVISDSYFDLVQNTIAPEIFAGYEYWYYNKWVKTGPGISRLNSIDKFDLLKKIRQFDVILLMVSQVNMHAAFFGFTEETYAALHPGFPQNPVLRYEETIRNTRDWFTQVAGKAHRVGYSLERMITIDARYQFFSDYPNLTNKTSADSIEYIACCMRNDPKTNSYIRGKARKNNYSFDQMLRMDASWIYAESKKKH